MAARASVISGLAWVHNRIAGPVKTPSSSHLYILSTVSGRPAYTGDAQ